jgi:hypothetical protein
VADHRRQDGSGWAVLADPEGNERAWSAAERDTGPPSPEPAEESSEPSVPDGNGLTHCISLGRVGQGASDTARDSLGAPGGHGRVQGVVYSGTKPRRTDISGYNDPRSIKQAPAHRLPATAEESATVRNRR